GIEAQPLFDGALPRQGAADPEAGKLLDRCYQKACRELAGASKQGRRRVALRAVSTLWSARRRPPLDETTLEGLGELLPAMGPEGRDEALEADVAADIGRAADLLRHPCAARWTAPVRAAWLRLDPRVRQRFLGAGAYGGTVDQGRSASLELAGGAV